MQGEVARGPHRSPEPRIKEQGGSSTGSAILGPSADNLEAGVTTSRDCERPAALHGKNVDAPEDLLMLQQQLTSVSRFGMEITEEIKEDIATRSTKKRFCAPRPDADAAWPADFLPRESGADVAGRFESTVGWGLEALEGAAGGQDRPMDKQEKEIARPVAVQLFCVPMQVFCFHRSQIWNSNSTSSLTLS